MQSPWPWPWCLYMTMALLASFFGRNTNFLEYFLGLRPRILFHFFREICITSSEWDQQWSNICPLNWKFQKFDGKIGTVVNNDCTKFEPIWFVNKKVLPFHVINEIKEISIHDILWQIIGKNHRMQKILWLVKTTEYWKLCQKKFCVILCHSVWFCGFSKHPNWDSFENPF